jgi:hypothetical protein
VVEGAGVVTTLAAKTGHTASPPVATAGRPTAAASAPVLHVQQGGEVERDGNDRQRRVAGVARGNPFDFPLWEQPHPGRTQPPLLFLAQATTQSGTRGGSWVRVPSIRREADGKRVGGELGGGEQALGDETLEIGLHEGSEMGEAGQNTFAR